MSTTTAEVKGKALTFVFATHGRPRNLYPTMAIIAQEFKDFLKLDNIKHILGAPYHPALRQMGKLNEQPEP